MALDPGICLPPRGQIDQISRALPQYERPPPPRAPTPVCAAAESFLPLRAGLCQPPCANSCRRPAQTLSDQPRTELTIAQAADAQVVPLQFFTVPQVLRLRCIFCH